ncbi:MAG: hypothetical protein KDI31_13285, partial [Pseudomonadales bacterium]|nr:hypothetical protein [Pseudomonadales bacterium]
MCEKLDHAIGQLDSASNFAKHQYQNRVLELSARLLQVESGVEQLYQRIVRLEAAGIFNGTDWQKPDFLIARLVPHTLENAEKSTVMLDSLSHLRMLAILDGRVVSERFSPQQARSF